MKNSKSPSKPVCMSIGPFGATEAEQSYRKSLEIVLSEALSSNFDFKPFWALPRIDMPSDIFKTLVEADLVIADLRGLNPNVMYELGIRHAFNKPILHLIDKRSELSWDIDKNYTIEYSVPIQVSDKDGLVQNIKDRVDAVMSLKKDGKPSYNTFHRIYRSAAQIENSSEIPTDLKVVLQQLNLDIRAINSSVEEIRGKQNIANSNVPRTGYYDSMASQIMPIGQSSILGTGYNGSLRPEYTVNSAFGASKFIPEPGMQNYWQKQGI